MRQRLGYLVGVARRAPLTADGTFGPQACPHQMAGDFAATPCLKHST